MASPLITRVREAIRVRHYSIRTEKTYVDWIKRYIRFHQMKHPESVGAEGVKRFLTWLAVEQNVAASTQNQALNALVFLYREVLSIDLGNFGGAVRAKKTPNLPPYSLKKKC